MVPKLKAHRVIISLHNSLALAECDSQKLGSLELSLVVLCRGPSPCSRGRESQAPAGTVKLLQGLVSPSLLSLALASFAQLFG